MSLRALKGIVVLFLTAKIASAQLVASYQTESPFIDFLGKTDSVFWTAETYRENGFNHRLYIRSYNWDLQPRSTTEIELPHYENTQAFIACNKLIVTDKQMEGEERKFYVKNIIHPSGDKESTRIEIFNINCWKENKKLNTDAYDFFSKVSTTKNHVLFIYENNYRDELPNEIKVRVMSPHDSLSEEKILTVPYGCNLAETRSYVFDDASGQRVFILVTVFDREPSKKRKVIRTELFTFDLISGEKIITEIPVGSNYGSCKMSYEKGKLLFGFFKKGEDESVFTGMKFAVYSDSLLFTGNVDLEEALSGKYKFIKGRPDTYKIRTLDLNDQGKIFAIVEKNNREVTGSGAPMMGSNGSFATAGSLSLSVNQTTYYAEDLIVLGISLQGKSKFTQVIKKKSDLL